MTLILLMQDGSTKAFGIGDSVQSLVRVIQREDVQTIVAGDIKGKQVVWEKQFQAVDVMPINFGKGK